MRVSAIEGEESRGAGIFAEHVDVGDGACEDHRDGRGTRGAGEGGAFEGGGDWGVEGIFVARLADDGVRVVKMAALSGAEIAGPKRWQVAQIAESARRGEGQDFELVFEEVGAGGDFEGAAVILGAANDGQRGV